MWVSPPFVILSTLKREWLLFSTDNDPLFFPDLCILLCHLSGSSHLVQTHWDQVSEKFMPFAPLWNWQFVCEAFKKDHHGNGEILNKTPKLGQLKLWEEEKRLQPLTETFLTSKNNLQIKRIIGKTKCTNDNYYKINWKLSPSIFECLAGQQGRKLLNIASYLAKQEQLIC